MSAEQRLLDCGGPRGAAVVGVCTLGMRRLALAAAILSGDATLCAEGTRPDLTTASPIARNAAEHGATPAAATLADVPQLIEALGSSSFAERARAEEQLLRLGQDVYDAVVAAKEHPDLEVRERIHYIELRLQIDWVRPDDPLPARKILARYKTLNEQGRIACLAHLAALPDGQGIGPLCRMARFDSYPSVAKSAALAILSAPDHDLSRGGALARAIERELGDAQQVPAQWIRIRLTSLTDPQAALAALNAAIDAELAELRVETEGIDPRVTFRLVKHHLGQCRATGTATELAAALGRVIDFDAENPDDEIWARGLAELAGARLDAGVATLIYTQYLYEESATPGATAMCWAIDWCLAHRCHDALAKLLTDRTKLAASERGCQYLAATGWRQLGRAAEATAAANAAYQRPDPNFEECKAAADALAEWGAIPWAEREYRRIIDDNPVATFVAIQSRESLAQWLHDREEYAGAAEVLAEVTDAIRTDAALRKAVNAAIEERSRSGSAREYLSGLSGRRYLYAACQAEAAGDGAAQRSHLKLALASNQHDPDVLIALYRLTDDDAESHRTTQYHIEREANRLRSYVKDVDDNPLYYAQLCNQYAWLVSNTEGNYEEALELSLNSLKARPDEPSFLDTLGRCYYAVGDLDKALEAQSRACELSPHVRVMQRQLEFFRQEKAKRAGQ